MSERLDRETEKRLKILVGFHKRLKQAALSYKPDYFRKLPNLYPFARLAPSILWRLENDFEEHIPHWHTLFVYYAHYHKELRSVPIYIGIGCCLLVYRWDEIKKNYFYLPIEKLPEALSDPFFYEEISLVCRELAKKETIVKYLKLGDIVKVFKKFIDIKKL